MDTRITRAKFECLLERENSKFDIAIGQIVDIQKKCEK